MPLRKAWSTAPATIIRLLSTMLLNLRRRLNQCAEILKFLIRPAFQGACEAALACGTSGGSSIGHEDLLWHLLAAAAAKLFHPFHHVNRICLSSFQSKES